MPPIHSATQGVFTITAEWDAASRCVHVQTFRGGMPTGLHYSIGAVRLTDELPPQAVKRLFDLACREVQRFGG